ncbi:MAG: DUF1971 domain-containing protein [Lentisphaerales bacterium]|nr:DUF1971 domain-containing protein [Lentisphaerales bacterium]
MKALPENVQLYKSTPVFNQDTIPKGILNQHNTKAGTWGKLVVLSGEVIFVDLQNNWEITATADRPVNIVPEAWHHLKVCGPVELKVEFYKE